MRKLKPSSLSVSFAALLLAACATAPHAPQDSEIATPAAWSQSLGTDANVQVEHEWWQNFGDPMLDALIAEAIANNKSLQVALARVEEARANRGIARASLRKHAPIAGLLVRACFPRSPARLQRRGPIRDSRASIAR